MDCKGYECINSYGSYRCECDIGHRLEGDHCIGMREKKKKYFLKLKNISYRHYRVYGDKLHVFVLTCSTAEI